MSDKNTVFISYTFYPIEGGIQTYLKKVAENWKIGEVRVFCKKEKNVPDIIDDPLYIERFQFKSQNYFSAILKLGRILFDNKKHLLSKLRLFSLLMINRSALKQVAEFSENVITSLRRDSFNPDVIQCSVPIYTGLIGVILKYLNNSKLVIYIHGSELLIFGKDKIRRKILKFVFDFADVIISNSNYTKNKAIELGADQKKVKVVNLGADTDKFYPLDTKKEVYEKFNISQENKLLLTISHLVPRKGNDMVIKALPKVLKNYPNVTYLIGGRGEYESQLKKMIKKLKLENNVKFTGFIEDNELNKLMNACDIFIMPNRQEGSDVEGYGIVFMEANACKKPVIGGNSGGVTDAIIDGKTGFLVNPISEEDIANKILKLLNSDDLYKRMSLTGYKLVKTERNWNKVVNKIEELVIRL